MYQKPAAEIGGLQELEAKMRSIETWYKQNCYGQQSEPLRCYFARHAIEEAVKASKKFEDRIRPGVEMLESIARKVEEKTGGNFMDIIAKQWQEKVKPALERTIKPVLLS